jgi:hypothetical protein
VEEKSGWNLPEGVRDLYNANDATEDPLFSVFFSSRLAPHIDQVPAWAKRRFSFGLVKNSFNFAACLAFQAIWKLLVDTHSSHDLSKHSF